jgi:predicted GIY-YIG superfamily endonuclease
MTKKPNNYWNFENCKNEAIKYSCKTDFEKGSRGAHHSAISNKWIDKICSHMIKGKNSNGHWNFIRCKEEALKYNKKTDFQKKSRSAYASAIKNSWLDEICQHMIQIKKPNGFWTLEKCQEEALKFTTRTDFIKNSNGAYDAAYKNNWVNEICQHMTSYKWTFDECKEIASKYKMRKEFQMNSSGAYHAAHANGWIDEICRHMYKNQPSLRHIYSYEFSDNHVYIGLTKNIKQRNYEHLIEINENKLTTVHKYINLTGLQPNLKIIYENLNEEEAKIKENEILNEYKNNNWIILNKVKTGSIGGGRIKWTFEKCQEEALKYKTRNEFNRKSSSAHASASNNGWLNEICLHMIEIKKPKGYWTFEKCKEVALLCKTRTEFQDKYKGAYNIVKKNNWCNDIYSHMIEKQKSKNYWNNKKICLIEALKYDNKTDFNLHSAGAYRSVLNNNWLDEMCQHMSNIKKSNGYWTFEKCQEEALKFNNRTDFSKYSSSAYCMVIKNKWDDIICKHMVKIIKYSYEICKEESLKYNNRSEFSKKSSNAYNISRKNSWLDEFYPNKKP